MTKQNPPRIPLNDGWSRRVKSAMLHVIALADVSNHANAGLAVHHAQRPVRSSPDSQAIDSRYKSTSMTASDICQSSHSSAPHERAGCSISLSPAACVRPRRRRNDSMRQVAKEQASWCHRHRRIQHSVAVWHPAAAAKRQRKDRWSNTPLIARNKTPAFAITARVVFRPSWECSFTGAIPHLRIATFHWDLRLNGDRRLTDKRTGRCPERRRGRRRCRIG